VTLLLYINLPGLSVIYLKGWRSRRWRARYEVSSHGKGEGA
jgi:hypothetical protein